MSTPSPFSTLIELATREVDQASTRLRVAIQTEEETGKKLALLEHYRENYKISCQKDMVNGLSIWKYQNFQVFLENIDRAITSQQDVIRRARERVEMERKAWQAAERKRLSYKVLDNQAAQRKLRRENQRDQKLADEHALRQHRHEHKS